jgi:murein L,D-transpeptidase YafK
MSKLIFGLLTTFFLLSPKTYIPDSPLAKQVRTKLYSKLKNDLAARYLKMDSAIYIRIFKEENELEIWVKSGEKYSFFKSYNICTFSGGLGTKTRNGDGKSPEGFYTIEPMQLNPISNYYLAVNIGYPNKLETLKGYTGSAIMIHGHCESIGCYAMTNDGIEEIYTMVYLALKGGQKKINLDIFPFRMSAANMEKYAIAEYLDFWETLKPGYDLFNEKFVPTDAGIEGNSYVFNN